MGFWDMATMSYKGVPTELGNKIVNDGNSVLDMRFNPVKEIYEVQVKSDDGILVDGYNVFQDGDYEQMAQYADASVTDVLMPVSNGAMIAGVMSGVFGLAFIITLWCIQGTPKGCKSKRSHRTNADHGSREHNWESQQSNNTKTFLNKHWGRRLATLEKLSDN